jgi:Domain of unknown function (DUF5069)
LGYLAVRSTRIRIAQGLVYKRVNRAFVKEDIVPLISSSVVGPLGVMHLPRVWLKILLHAQGRLPEGYRHGAGGFDELLCANLGIDREAFVSYIEDTKPTYLQLESWVRQNAKNLSAASIAAHNRMIEERELPEDKREERWAAVGLTDRSITKGVALNDLDDWTAAYHSIVGNLR